MPISTPYTLGATLAARNFLASFCGTFCSAPFCVLRPASFSVHRNPIKSFREQHVHFDASQFFNIAAGTAVTAYSASWSSLATAARAIEVDDDGSIQDMLRHFGSCWR